MLKLLMWLVVLGGIYVYSRLRAARRHALDREREEQRQRQIVVDVEAEVIDVDDNPRG